jgi:hypothetical protein
MRDAACLAGVWTRAIIAAHAFHASESIGVAGGVADGAEERVKLI